MIIPISRRHTLSAILSTGVIMGGIQEAKSEGFAEIMPPAEDFTSMWWKDGFPTVVKGASWVRNIHTGHYAFAMDTRSMEVTEFGPVAAGMDYDSFATGGAVGGSAAGPADLRMTISVDGKTYRCVEGGEATRHGGPRLVESGRFFQRGDVTDLVFAAEDGERLNVDSRFEVAAWPEDLGMILTARPGLKAIEAGEVSFGKVGGGYGLDESNDLVVENGPGLDGEKLTLGLWVYVPKSYAMKFRASPWLVCKDKNETVDGNFGIILRDGKPEARLNIGGKGKESQYFATSRSPVNVEAWNHVALAYDGDVLSVFLNGRQTGKTKVGKARKGTDTPIVFGRRGDSDHETYRFNGVIDEIRMYDQALDEKQIRQIFNQPGKELPNLQATGNWSFDVNGKALEIAPREEWKNVSMKIDLAAADGALGMSGEWKQAEGEVWSSGEWEQASLSVKPASFEAVGGAGPIELVVKNLDGGQALPVRYDADLNCHRVNISKVKAIAPPGQDRRSNDSIERMQVAIKNPSAETQVARLIFEKPDGGIGNGLGGVTGISAMFRDKDGNPTGIPVQLSKNWHTGPGAGEYAGGWFRAISQLRLPPGSEYELELTVSYGHWGGVAAASHAQLCLIGWGSNQHWSQSALGSWGESICYEPAQGQANCTITDVRPVMVNGGKDEEKWKWTSNVGGGDFFRFFDTSGERIAHSAMQSIYHKHGPCLTEVTFAGKIGEEIRHSSTVSLGRSDDITRGVYRVRLDVDEAVDFSRFVIFQVGADTYNFTKEPKLAMGNVTGVTKEWNATWGGDTYRTEPMEFAGNAPWVSMHEAVWREGDLKGAWANRGIVLRGWEAKIGGKSAPPFIAEHGVKRGPHESSTIDFVTPPGVTRLEKGDYIEAIFEHVVMPQSAEEYYGPNEELRDALRENANTWKMIYREATGNSRAVEVNKGSLEGIHPDIRIKVDQDEAEFTLRGGIGYVPVTFTGLSAYRGYTLSVDGKPIDQAVNGNDFWQSDYDAVTKLWSHTYNVRAGGVSPVRIKFSNQ